MGGIDYTCVYRTEENWEPESWSDIQSESDGENDQHTLNVVLAPDIWGTPCFDHSWVKHEACGLELSSSVTTSPSDFSRAHADIFEFQTEASSVSQENTERSKKICRPGKSQRGRFRKFVDKLKARMQDAGASFDFDTLVLPTAFNKNSTRNKIRDILTAYRRSLLGRSDY